MLVYQRVTPTMMYDILLWNLDKYRISDLESKV